jgi:hypothetical protein
MSNYFLLETLCGACKVKASPKRKNKLVLAPVIVLLLNCSLSLSYLAMSKVAASDVSSSIYFSFLTSLT